MNKLILCSAVVVTLLAVFVKQGASILCWQCNSAMDPYCGEYDFNPHTLAQVDCRHLRRDHLANMQAVYCRKIVQNIEGRTRTVRGCGWLEDSRYPDGECYKRTGTKDIQVTYCHCNSDGCNPGNTVKASVGMAAVLLLLTKIF